MTISLEGEMQQQGDLVRVRIRLCEDNFIVDAFSRTFNLVASLGSILFTIEEFIPHEFRKHPIIQKNLYDPLEEAWAHRLRHGGL